MKSSDKAAPADESKSAPAPALVKVKITADNGHRHAGTKHPKGAVVPVTEGDAKQIVDTFKVGEYVKGE
ncbi:DUF7210 family protein [Pseudomonas citronellolis]|uniref:DUF7210 family protein n=1 Tax=Pseudomonas citronellolis TaxID=53408 RepID=UPI0023E458A4|nr:hypothetical protein [Pseudomonas citronellolis]MDF3931395.1 hypothetical protein [Pseudomonas citronellolis]